MNSDGNGKHRAAHAVESGMSKAPHSPAAIARAYTDAVNRRAYAEAAELLAEDVELDLPRRSAGWPRSVAREQGATAAGRAHRGRP